MTEQKETTRIKERNLVFADLEFSGLELHHEIVQIGAVVVSQPDFKVLTQWQARVKPQHLDQADPKALKLIGYTDEKWQDAIELKPALEQFSEVAKDGVLVGYNVVMDFLHLKKAYAELNMPVPFHWQVLDVLSMVYYNLYDTPLQTFRTGEVIEYLTIPSDKHHDALEDSWLAYKMFMKLWERKQS